MPGWLNQTSTISPAGRISFAHYENPVLGAPDYTLVEPTAFPTITANGGGGGGGAVGCAAGVGGREGAASLGGDISASYSGGTGGSGYVYCKDGALNGGAGGSSAGTSAAGANGANGCFYKCIAYGGTAPAGGGNGGDALGWDYGGPVGEPGAAPGGGGAGSGAAQDYDGYAAGAGADGKAVLTPDIGSPTTYSTAGVYSYTVPDSVTSLSVQLWGAGGGGGRGYSEGGTTAGAGGGGGGGGAYAESTSISVAGGETLSVVVGDGGAVGAAVPAGSGEPAGSGLAGGDTSIQEAFPALAASGGGGGGGAVGCAAGVGGNGGAASVGGDVSASYSGGTGGTGYVYCKNGALNGGAGGSSAGTSAAGSNGANGCYYKCVAAGGVAPVGGGDGGDALGWDNGGPVGEPGVSAGGGGAGSAVAQDNDGYQAGAGADGEAVLTPDVGSSTTYSSAGVYSYTVPSGASSLIVQLWGAGGGGGRGYSKGGTIAGAGGGGGGGGAYVESTSIPVSGGETLRVTVGAGGAVGAAVAPGSGDPAGGGAAGGETSIRYTPTPLVTSYMYDDYGRITQEVMPKGNANVTVEPGGSLVGTPDTTYATTYEYYAFGATAAPPSGVSICSGGGVDQWGRLESSTVFGETPTTFVYDLAGNVLAEADAAGTACSVYDGEDELTSTQAPGDSAATSYAYDPVGLELDGCRSYGEGGDRL